MIIALAQLNYTIADIEGNIKKIKTAIKEAVKSKADLLVFSELAVCGYPPDDLLDYPHFIKQCEKAVLDIAAACTEITVILGAPMENPLESGRRLYNAACILEKGVIREIVYKTLLPNYDVFNEARYFEVNDRYTCVDICGVKCAVTICEDLWHETDRFDYLDNPMLELSAQKPAIMINISASPYNIGKRRERIDILKQQCQAYNLPLIYVNQVGGHTDLIFDGNSLVLNNKGQVVMEMPKFEEALMFYDTNGEDVVLSTENEVEDSEIDLLTRALVFGLRDYFMKSGFRSAVVGSSGGIDSAVVQALISDAIGPQNVTAILMPSPYSSEGSVADAVELAKRLGNPYHIIPIEGMYTAITDSMKPVFNDLPFGLAEENMQARARALILMAYSNKFGSILVNTSNKSEMSVGYTTLYGDMCGSVSVIGDVYKTNVYKMAHHINRFNRIIPEAIITKAPSAELRPNQKDSDSLPDYPVLDAILKLYIEHHMGPDAIASQGFEPELVNIIIQMVNRNEYKRFQAPPVLRVSGKAFGRGRIIPLVSKW